VLLPLPLGPCRNRRSPLAMVSEGTSSTGTPGVHENFSPEMWTAVLLIAGRVRLALRPGGRRDASIPPGAPRPAAVQSPKL
jgi:hypothetical protein